ncbi:regulator, BldB [Streptomyces gardneri]|uniref:Regulator, BldB n=1 Tax=Streptomyces gardneri TaxID=66892 RepID=A0A4Y3RTS6_9ACTN|nr:regulator, BldB [Streptomyces gardneri]GHH15461.1 regulator, BldB [Streptomyces gardneri]
MTDAHATTTDGSPASAAGSAVDGTRDSALAAERQREKDELYALDISGVEWEGAPGTSPDEERVEIARLPEGAVAMRSSLDKETVLRYTKAEWDAFVLGARDGEFDLR